MSDPKNPAESPNQPEPIDRFKAIQLEMMRSLLIEPLLTQVRTNPDDLFDVIITLNEFYKDGVEAARTRVEGWVADLRVADGQHASRTGRSSSRTSLYVFATLTGAQLVTLVERQAAELKTVLKASQGKAQRMAQARAEAPIYRMWEDSEVSVCLTKSITTVKADAAHRAFVALGNGIVWAVLDSGIDHTHPHFSWKAPSHTRGGDIRSVETLTLPPPLQHEDFTPRGADESDDPSVRAQTDRLGHGTHVAGIIAGYYETPSAMPEPIVGAQVLAEKPQGDKEEALYMRDTLTRISGVAPRCKLVSMKVIADVTDKATKRVEGKGKVSWILEALQKIQDVNAHGRRIRIHGVNLSVGYEFNPRWFACGQSPLCVEVDRLVKSGVCVVVAAGNGGYSSYLDANSKVRWGYDLLNISDPGNAELAITVGSTHRDMPHMYGVSYFSSKGPTGDGRLKPDLVAPGERIISCAAGLEQKKYEMELARSDDEAAPDPEVGPLDAAAPATAATTGAAVAAEAQVVAASSGTQPATGIDASPGAVVEMTVPAAAEDRPTPRVLYCEMSGTSMAAPHVSGALAAFLSVRTEFIGKPERVKEIFLQTTIDLRRQPHFQGAGLLDLMKALHSV